MDGRSKNRGQKGKVKYNDSEIIRFWKMNPKSTLSAVQSRFGAGYPRVKKLKKIAVETNDVVLNAQLPFLQQSFPALPPMINDVKSDIFPLNFQGFKLSTLKTLEKQTSLSPALPTDCSLIPKLTAVEKDTKGRSLEINENLTSDMVKNAKMPLKKKRRLSSSLDFQSLKKTDEILSASLPAPKIIIPTTSLVPNNQSLTSVIKVKKKRKRRQKSNINKPSAFVLDAYSTANANINIVNEESDVMRLRFRRRKSWIIEVNKVLKKMVIADIHHFFCKPVNFVELNIPDYPLVVRMPMDFQTLANKLNSGVYANVGQFVIDAELIFINAKMYNPRTHLVHERAEHLQQTFQELMQHCVSEFGSCETRKKWETWRKPGGYLYAQDCILDKNSKAQTKFIE